MMSNAEFIAAHRAGKFRAGGMHAASVEVLLTCPLCGIPNFSDRGLAAHCCRAKPGREKLSHAELTLARTRATNPAPAQPQSTP